MTFLCDIVNSVYYFFSFLFYLMSCLLICCSYLIISFVSNSIGEERRKQNEMKRNKSKQKNWKIKTFHSSNKQLLVQWNGRRKIKIYSYIVCNFCTGATNYQNLTNFWISIICCRVKCSISILIQSHTKYIITNYK